MVPLLGIPNGMPFDVVVLSTTMFDIVALKVPPVRAMQGE